MANPTMAGTTVESVEVWHCGGPTKGWMLNGEGKPVPRIIKVPVEDQFRKTDEKGFSIHIEKGFRPAADAKDAKCPDEVLGILLDKRAKERELGPTIEDKVAAEVERRMGDKAPKRLEKR